MGRIKEAANCYPWNQESFFQLSWLKIVYAKTRSTLDEGSLS